MLILTRRVGETVMIGNDVTVTILGVKGNQVRVGINAPKNVAVHREEIYERIKREQQGDSQGEPRQRVRRVRLRLIFPPNRLARVFSSPRSRRRLPLPRISLESTALSLFGPASYHYALATRATWLIQLISH